MKSLPWKCLSPFFLLVIAFGCAAPQPETKPWSRSNAVYLEEKLKSAEHRQKVDAFIVIMDASGTMLDRYQGKTKLSMAKNFVHRLDDSLPASMTLIAGLRMLGQHFGDGTRLVYGMKTYKIGDIAKAADGIQGSGGRTPLDQAIAAATEDLTSVRGNMAVIVVSDGIASDEKSVKAAQDMKARYGNRVCIYSVLIGADPQGASVMSQIAQSAKCGFSLSLGDIASTEAMADYVQRVFMEKTPPRPIVQAKPIAPQAPKDSDGDGVPDDLDKCPDTPKGVTVDERGCWAYDAVLMFDFGSHKIKPEAYPMLDEAVSILEKNPEIQVEIQGYTCDIGPDAFNQKLSEKRAGAVKTYFADHGISPERLTAIGYGKSRAAYPNDSKENRAKNRRVELRPFR